MTGTTEDGAPAIPTAAAGTPEAAAVPLLRVLAGRPTDEELAALLAVLTAVSTGDEPAPGRTGSRWGAPAGRLQTSYGPGRGGWRSSGLPG